MKGSLYNCASIQATVQAVNSFGGITQCTHSGSAVTGTGVSVYSSITLSDATTQVLPSSSTITYSAIATISTIFNTTRFSSRRWFLSNYWI